MYLGNLNSQRDWGHAKDYVEAMYLILQQDKPEDFVIATGVTTSIRDFVIMAFREVGIELLFKGEKENETAEIVTSKNTELKPGTTVIKIDSRYYRPTEVELLIGDGTKAFKKLGWKPTYTLAQLVKEMVESDLELFKRNLLLKESGFTIKHQYE